MPTPQNCIGFTELKITPVRFLLYWDLIGYVYCEYIIRLGLVNRVKFRSAQKSEVSIVFGKQVGYAFIGMAGNAYLKNLRYFALSQADINLVLDKETYRQASASGATVEILDTNQPVASELPAPPSADNSYSAGTFVRNIAPARKSGTGEPRSNLGWIWSETDEQWLASGVPSIP